MISYNPENVYRILNDMCHSGKARIIIDYAASSITANSVETAFAKILCSSKGKNEARNTFQSSYY